MMSKGRCFRIFVLCLIALRLHAAPPPGRSAWVDSVYRSLNTEERIGQLMMVAAYSGGPNYNQDAITRLIDAHQIGGLIFMQGGPARQAVQTNLYQHRAQVPLLISMDAEWGLGMRLDSVASFPKQMMLGATRDTALVYQMGSAIAAQCRRLGVHIDFAPVVDINNNPLNPVINMRAFGQDKTLVARLGIAYVKGLQQHGVIACAKHFPGHGDTDADSHKDLPVIKKSLAQLDTLELYPFRELIKAGVKSMMVAHLEIPALESEPHVPTTLSTNTITNLLKNKMGYTGLVFTDALNMQGVSKYFRAGDAELRAFLAGNDVLLFAQDVPTAITRIREAIDQGQISMAELEKRVRKILYAKYDAGLSQFQDISTDHIVEDLNREIVPLRARIAEQAITLVRDQNQLLPRLTDRKNDVQYIGVNASGTAMGNGLLESVLLSSEWLGKGSSEKTARRLLDSIDKKDLTVIGVHSLNIYPANNFGLDAVQMDFLKKAQQKPNVVFAVMGNPYFLNNLCNAGTALVGYDDDTTTQKAMVQALLRKKPARGKLPVSVCLNASSSTGKATDKELPFYMGHTANPARAGVTSPESLRKVSALINRCISERAFPGCRILASKDGKIFYDSSFGTYDYDDKHKVQRYSMYDLASMTKVLATTLAVMKLYEEKKISLDQNIGFYLPAVRGSDKSQLLVRQLLLHEGGLRSWIPFYKETLDKSGNLREDLYRSNPEPGFGTQVANHLYILSSYRDTIWNRIYASDLENRGKYVYSDLDFYFLAAIVEAVTHQSLDAYVNDNFYKPMGLTSICFNPSRFKDTGRIAPTENDRLFRHQQLRGYVHDQGAAMLGGVSGHAGLFGTAGDVASIFYMLLNKGTYENKAYFKKETVERFTAYSSSLSRRGLGFDKPDASATEGGPAGERCSGRAFGHQGFTGTCGWADPETGVVFVFLSNRVYPDAENGLINRLNVRTSVQDYLYESLGIPVDRNRPFMKEADLRSFGTAKNGR